MPYCAAVNCHNLSEKGYSMRVIPRDTERRAKWVENVGRKNWIPTNNSVLCEVILYSTLLIFYNKIMYIYLSCIVDAF
ncbi:hypothetical protein X777_09854 [Ooceraea biroi]|uniref:THAP-type domain-containing protein n=1 Tax=Ooceraea biroi TaxID=2015173 RepID=A0A026W5M2_OOCBI|nr:hypothetical protein X777_09854 [Ooceraea biroi]